jgi:hypothetical protein
MKADAFVRISCCSHAEAKELALRLRARGYAAVVRRWKTVIAYIEPSDEATPVVPQPQVGVGPRTAFLWERAPRNPPATRVQRVASITPSATSSLWPWV